MYKNSINLPLFYNKSFDVVVNLQMNLRNWGVSGGVGFGGSGPAAILGVGLHPPSRESEKLGGGVLGVPIPPPPPWKQNAPAPTIKVHIFNDFERNLSKILENF